MLGRALSFGLCSILLYFLYHSVYLKLTTQSKYADTNVEPSASRFEVAMKDLVQQYFPTTTKRIKKDDFEQLVAFSADPAIGRGLSMIVQVIEGRIFVDRTRWKNDLAWDTLRAQFILEELRLLLKQSAMPDFEFVLNVHDCPLRKSSDTTMFSITACKNRNAVPLPQWFQWRDKSFSNWDDNMAKSFMIAEEIPWSEKSDKAVFYGALRKSSLFETENGQLEWIDTTVQNWHTFGRGKLWKLQQDHPDLFDVGIMRASSVEDLPDILNAMNWERKSYLTMEEQFRGYKYVIYVEGTCGWADRLKNLLSAGMVVFLQSTPCHEFFQPLLKPWVHYIPIQNDLSDLVEKVKWARSNPEPSREIGLNAADFAKTHLSVASWRYYLQQTMKAYADLMDYAPKRRNGTMRFKGAVTCHNMGKPHCNIDAAFTT